MTSLGSTKRGISLPDELADSSRQIHQGMEVHYFKFSNGKEILKINTFGIRNHKSCNEQNENLYKESFCCLSYSSIRKFYLQIHNVPKTQTLVQYNMRIISVLLSVH